MGIFNDNIHNPHSTNSYINIRTPRGPPGPGFKLTQDGNYDIDNKQLKNIRDGTQDADVVSKKYIDDELNTKINNSEIMGSNAEAGKLVRYLFDKGIITPKLYIGSIIIKADEQDFDDTHLYIPNLKNYDGVGGRRRSEIIVTSTDQTITGKKTFQNSIEIQGTINIRQGALSINGTNSQISAADLNKLYNSSANNISTGKVPIYSNLAELYCDHLKLRFGYRSVQIKPNYQVSNNTIKIPNLGGSDRTLMFTSLNQTIRDNQTFSRTNHL